MRVTTDIWVSALTRRAFSTGGYAAIVHRGSSEAGAVMITVRNRMGETTLYAPAPQTSYDETKPEDRLFVEVTKSDDPELIDKKIERERKFDPDLWVVDLDVDDATFQELVGVTTP